MALGRPGALLMVRPANMLSENCLDAVIDALSVTCTVKLKLPVLVGVPVICWDGDACYCWA